MADKSFWRWFEISCQNACAESESRSPICWLTKARFFFVRQTVLFRCAPRPRTQDAEEPFDLRIEDLARHKDIPDTWIKCGTYTKDYNFDIQNDIFIDTTSNHVFSCPKNQKNIINNWSSLDDCLCDIFDSFSDCKFEY